MGVTLESDTYVNLDILDDINNLIYKIKKTPQINLRGIKKFIEETLSGYQNEDFGAVGELEEYYRLIENVVSNNKSNSFDNKYGTIMKLKKILSKYTPKDKKFSSLN